MHSKNFFFILILLIIFLTIYINSKINDQKIYFPIKTIIINSEIINSDKKSILYVVKKYVNKKSFFNLNVDILRRKIDKIEWIRSVKVRKIFPNEVQIEIEENVPIAIWNNKSYINDLGEIFFVNKIKKKLPNFVIPKNRRHVILNYYFLLNKNLAKNKIEDSIAMIIEEDTRVLSFLLSSNIMVKIGSRDINDKIVKFFKIYNKLNSGDLEKIEYIDMRYSNGFVIKWKSNKYYD